MEALIGGLGVVAILGWLVTILALLAVIALPLVIWRGAHVLAEVRDELRHLGAAVEDWRRAIERGQSRPAPGPGDSGR